MLRTVLLVLALVASALAYTREASVPTSAHQRFNYRFCRPRCNRRTERCRFGRCIPRIRPSVQPPSPSVGVPSPSVGAPTPSAVPSPSGADPPPSNSPGPSPSEAVVTPTPSASSTAGCTLTCSLYERLDEKACECVSLIACDGRVRMRREYREVPAGERAAFVRAVKQLNEEGIWGELAQIHSDNFGSIHSNGNFYPWHAGFLFLIESLIMDREPSIMGLPYFQWGAETNTRTSTMWGPDFLGSSAPGGGPIPDGPFENFAVGGTAVTRNFDELDFVETDNLATIAAVIANRDGLPFWVAEGETDVSDELELLHDRFHLVVGGTMLGGTSPQDPVFFLHHAFVDKWWAKQWPAAGGFAPSDAAQMLDGLPLTRAFPTLGGFTLQNSVDIQACVTYVEPAGAAAFATVQTFSATTLANRSVSQSELEALAAFERKPVAQVAAVVSSINSEVSLASTA